jgi:hypothetical protein
VAEVTRSPDVPVSCSACSEMTVRGGAGNSVVVDPWPTRTATLREVLAGCTRRPCCRRTPRDRSHARST